MNLEIKALITAERQRSEFGFLTEIIQRGRNKPKKYRHDLAMPVKLYEELCNQGIVKPEDYYVEESAFFSFTVKEATISFVNLYACEDMTGKIDRYLIRKFAGSYPLRRNGRMF